MSRPKTEIDWARVDELLVAQCDGAGIASILGIHPNTLYRLCEEEFSMSFSAYSQQKRGEGRELLRAKQYELALSGDKTMLVWLGKQYLNQREKVDNDVSLTEKVKPVIVFGEEDEHTEQV